MRIFSTDPHHPGFFAVGQVAVGVVAVGQSALGVVAIGQLARGVVAVGQLACGVVAVGQGAVGLWHGTGMIAIAGQRGMGLALHLLPRLAAEPPLNLPTTTPLAPLLRGEISEGWVAARLVGSDLVDLAGATVDLAAIAQRLASGSADGFDRAHVKVTARVVAQADGYRATRTSVVLVAEDVILHRAPRRRLAYGVPPKGALGRPAGAGALLLRSLGWVLAVGLVTAVSFEPLVRALADVEASR